MRPITSRTTGTMTRRSRSLASCVSSVSAAAPPTRALGAGLVHDGPQLLDRRHRRLRVGRRGRGDVQADTTVDDDRRRIRAGGRAGRGTRVGRHRLDAVDALRRGGGPRPRRASSTMTTAGWTAPAGKWSTEHGLAGDRVDVREEDVDLAGPGRLEGGQERGTDAQGERREDPDRARPAVRRSARAVPRRRGRRTGPGRRRGPSADRVARGGARPEQDPRALAEHEQQRGQEGERAEQRGRDADRRDRSEAAVGAQVRQQEAEHAGDDGAGTGRDGLDAGPQGATHGLGRVLDVVELLPVARDQQQRVVDRGADHEDRQDALGLAVEDQRAVLGAGCRPPARRGRARTRR